MDKEKELVDILNSKLDINAFNRLYDRYFALAYSYILNRTGDEELTKEITSEAFIQAIYEVRDIDEDNTNTFSYVIFPLINDMIASSDVFNNQKAIAAMQLEENKARVLSTLLKLPRKEQELISMMFYTDIDGAEVAEILKIKIGALRSNLIEALTKFKREFVEKYPESEIFIL